ncbi:N-acetylmuramoyl-L-alanine amidase [Bacillus subtilis]|nr:N-acetylmuramoyl-L-alanine amidase [Bacillus subtilis]MED3474691.1 N-acetylmuramoyl-L-alanine amidase [Bacillus subtilis]
MAITKTLENGIKIGKAKVTVDIVDKGNPEIRPAISMKPSYITIHNTGNSGRGANAKAHNTYIHNMANLSPKDTGYASWHFSVDDVSIYQHLPLNETAWHTGDGSGPKSGNMTSIGIEICENVDMKDYHQAEENAIALVKYLIENMNGLSVSRIKPHQAWSGKYCPRVILGRDGSFDKFYDRIKKACGAKTAAKKPAPSKKSSANEDLGSEVYGTIKVLADHLNIREKADFNSKILSVADKGDTFKVYGQKNGLYYLGSKGYTSSNSKYVKFTKNSSYGAKKAKLVIVKAAELWVYDKADWNAKKDTVKKNEAFTIDKELTVKGSKMYKLKSGLYITANPEFVTVK